MPESTQPSRHFSSHARSAAYSGESDQGSGVKPISVPVDSDQVIGAERRWRDADSEVQKKIWKLVGAELDRESGDLGGGGKGRRLSPFIPRSSLSRSTVREKNDCR